MNESKRLQLAKPWTVSTDEVLEKLKVAPAEGPSPAEVKKRGKEFGPNIRC